MSKAAWDSCLLKNKHGAYLPCLSNVVAIMTHRAEWHNVIAYDDFAKLDLRIATVLECIPHPNADKLLVLQIDLGTEKRQICAGLRQHIPDPASMVGKQIVVVANLAPRQMRGQISQGMLLAATDAGTGSVIVVTPSAPAVPGSKVS